MADDHFLLRHLGHRCAPSTFTHLCMDVEELRGTTHPNFGFVDLLNEVAEKNPDAKRRRKTLKLEKRLGILIKKSVAGCETDLAYSQLFHVPCLDA